jgi:hypothetical protein
VRTDSWIFQGFGNAEAIVNVHGSNIGSLEMIGIAIAK